MRPGLEYTLVFYSIGQFILWVNYGLGQFISPLAKIYPRDVDNDVNIVERYTRELFNFSTS